LWLFFGIQIIHIGQSSLLNQMLSVFVLVSSILLAIYRFGNQDSKIGSRLTIKKMRTEAKASRRKYAFHYLEPNEEEQRVMRQYLLLPYKPEEEDAMGTWGKDWEEELPPSMTAR
jgi:hypothetical protein